MKRTVFLRNALPPCPHCSKKDWAFLCRYKRWSRHKCMCCGRHLKTRSRVIPGRSEPMGPPPFPEIDGVQFKSPPGYTAYAFSTDGRAWTCNARTRHDHPYQFLDKWSKLKFIVDKNGYHVVNLTSDNGDQSPHHVATQILLLFSGRRPIGMECRHLNGVPGDDRLENLKWGTRSENAQDRVTHGTCPLLKRGLEHPAAKLSDAQVQEIIIRKKRGESRADLASEFKVTRNHISTLVRCGGRNPRRKKKKARATSPWLA